VAVRRQIEVAGIVQGVGFRPFVYRLALERNLGGHIANTPSGVAIEVEGPELIIAGFVAHLRESAPPLARITGMAVREIVCNGEHEFRILASQRGARVQTLISPDVATCPDCRRELFDPADRRYGYPFINCTNCGSRFTIERDIPYDRPHTSMAAFPMCPACQAEYDDPLNRRFHAQPNACWDCGPQVELWSRQGEKIDCDDPIAAAAEALESGQVVAVKGLGGFHLAVNADDEAAVALLRERKHRVEKPFAVMVCDLAAADEFCVIDACARQTLEQVERPIVLLPWKKHAGISEVVAPGNRYLGVFLPYTPLHHLLFSRSTIRALVMTSGNRSEEPIAIDNCEAVRRLSDLADCFLVHNRDILLRCDDSVVRVVEGRSCQLRRSRGFVPTPVFLNEQMPALLAVGGELKNTICLTKDKHAFLSQHLGDLENLEGYRFFEEAIEHLGRVLEIKPEIVAYDLHPDYFSTKWALRQKGVQLIGVQHHHAHVASCMAENHLTGKVIGFAMDGTGYGTDGKIWGGEVMVAGYADFERMAHLEYVRMPGSSEAIREPWRMALSYLVHHFGNDWERLDVPFINHLDQKKAALMLRMMERDVNSPWTSSCGRLFDAVAALAGIRQVVNYEAQAAIELEMVITDDQPLEDVYPFELLGDGSGWVIGTKPLFRAIVRDLLLGCGSNVISRRFHMGLVQTFVQVAQLVRERTWIDQVCLSGGTFHNAVLLTNLRVQLEKCGFRVWTHAEVPAGDGGLSLGQALVAAHRVALIKNPELNVQDSSSETPRPNVTSQSQL